jgi:hypothetical protein
MSKTQIVFSFDTTGSMAPCLAEVRRRLGESLGRVLREVPDCEIGLIAHGDACDGGRGFSAVEFTNNLPILKGFVDTVHSTSGGDWDEWYEYVLAEAQDRFAWHPDATKMLVMIGDAQPHEAGYRCDVYHATHWEDAALGLAEMGVMVHTVQCLAHGRHDNRFWQPLAKMTNGYAVMLEQFSNVVELIVALGYRYDGDDPKAALSKYETELSTAGKLTRNVASVFDVLLERKAPSFVETVEERELAKRAVPPGRFQVLDVDRDTRINDFVKAQGLTFKTGRGFYQFTKRVLVQSYKEVVLRNKRTGDMFSGDEARRIAGIPIGTTANVSPVAPELRNYDCFIQSTSATRKLLGGTQFLYEVWKK